MKKEWILVGLVVLVLGCVLVSPVMAQEEEE